MPTNAPMTIIAIKIIWDTKVQCYYQGHELKACLQRKNDENKQSINLQLTVLKIYHENRDYMWKSLRVWSTRKTGTYKLIDTKSTYDLKHSKNIYSNL